MTRIIIRTKTEVTSPAIDEIISHWSLNIYPSPLKIRTYKTSPNRSNKRNFLKEVFESPANMLITSE